MNDTCSNTASIHPEPQSVRLQKTLMFKMHVLNSILKGFMRWYLYCIATYKSILS